MSKKTESYQKNYQKLKTIAEVMQNQDELDIDQLVKLVDEASRAYKNCQDRIEAVEKILMLKTQQSH